MNFDTCTEQVARLDGLRWRNERTDAAVEECVKSLMRNARNASQSERAITRLLDASDWYPTPAQIAMACAIEYRPAYTPAESNERDCTACGGSAYALVHLLVTWHGNRREVQRLTPEQYSELNGKIVHRIGVQELYHGAEPCTACDAGRTRALAQQSWAREDAESTPKRRGGGLQRARMVQNAQ